MQLKSLTCVCAALATLVTASIPAGAGFVRGTAKVNVPFEFVVSGKTMPAGKYNLEPSANQTLVTLRGERGSSVLVFMDRQSTSINDIAKPRLVFEKQNGKFLLKGVWSSTPGRK